MGRTACTEPQCLYRVTFTLLHYLNVNVVHSSEVGIKSVYGPKLFNPYPTAFPYGNGMVLHFYQQQESSTTKTVHRVINKGLKTYV